jgi:hypothetical protein
MQQGHLYYLAENCHPNEERARGRWMAFMRSTIAPQLEERAAARALKEAAKEEQRIATKARCNELAVLLGESREHSPFCRDMEQHFVAGKSVEDLPDRAVRIVRDIYAKPGGRRGSRGYEARLEGFDTKFMAPSPENESPSPLAVDRAKALSSAEEIAVAGPGVRGP